MPGQRVYTSNRADKQNTLHLLTLTLSIPLLTFLLVACGISPSSGGNVTIVNQGNLACTSNVLNTTANKLVSQFIPAQEAVYRLQDSNACRQGMPQNDGRNLGMGELVVKLIPGEYEGTPEPPRTLLVYTTSIFWGSKEAHSEVLADQAILTFVQGGGVDRSRISALWLIIVTQYNSCTGCARDVSATRTKLASQVGKPVVAGLWMVTAYINPYNPKSWVAPQSPQDITPVKLP